MSNIILLCLRQKNQKKIPIKFLSPKFFCAEQKIYMHFKGDAFLNVIRKFSFIFVNFSSSWKWSDFQNRKIEKKNSFCLPVNLYEVLL